ncbi:hypothetical protein GH714_017608 [Hevea brasiliensis]|uniref:RNase H type-1 domain-containing protein n=1 Tax=Hevea brasiliensis TaxID=3981 RepID=A0A6A6LA02_HEVBR|nr:hypothetical protein GH714_017608 [Hevea brasiliensis]
MNAAFLAKIGRRLLTEDDALRAKVVQGKYFGNDSRRGGGGGVLRDSMGYWIAALLVCLKVCNSKQAELNAFHHGLRMAWDLGFRRLLVELDSRTILDLVSKMEDMPNLRFINLVSQYRELINRSWQVQLVHCYREANKMTDGLANFAVTTPMGLHLLLSPLGKVVNLIS